MRLIHTLIFFLTFISWETHASELKFNIFTKDFLVNFQHRDSSPLDFPIVKDNEDLLTEEIESRIIDGLTVKVDSYCDEYSKRYSDQTVSCAIDESSLTMRCIQPKLLFTDDGNFFYEFKSIISLNPYVTKTWPKQVPNPDVAKLCTGYVSVKVKRIHVY